MLLGSSSSSKARIRTIFRPKAKREIFLTPKDFDSRTSILGPSFVAARIAEDHYRPRLDLVIKNYIIKLCSRIMNKIE